MGPLRLPILAAILASPVWCQNPGIIYSETVPVFRQGNTAGVFQIDFVVPPVGTYLPRHTVDIVFDGISTNPLQTAAIAIQ